MALCMELERRYFKLPCVSEDGLHVLLVCELRAAAGHPARPSVESQHLWFVLLGLMNCGVQTASATVAPGSRQQPHSAAVSRDS